MTGICWSRAPCLTAVVVVSVSFSLVGTSCTSRGISSPCSIQLQDVTAATGITFVHRDGSSGRRYIVETITTGLASFDYDGDGIIDIYLPNGASLPGCKYAPVPQHDLYRNEGSWKFTEVSEPAGIRQFGYGMGVTAADYDNDGFQDLYVSNYGPNVLYHNNGDGTFTDVTETAGVGRGHKVGAGVAYLDIDHDGNLDLYVANYVKFTFENHVVHTIDGHPQYVGPRDYEPESHELFRNNGDGTFTDVSSPSGIATYAGSGMGVVCCDYDGDGATDIFVLNDVHRNFFFRNDGTGKFEEVGLQIGAAYNGRGEELGSMGVECGDFDNDGWLDCVQTSYQGEQPVLFRNLGNGFFEDVTAATNAGAGTAAHVKWGVGLVDFDNDGYRDLFYACGHLQDNIELYDDTTAYRVRNVLLRNTGQGKFANVSDQCGDGLQPVKSSRGAAFDDLDNDGRIDAVIVNAREAPTILRNASAPGNHWLGIRLVGVFGNRDGVGAQVRVLAGDLSQVDEVHSGRGYQSHYGTRLHYGLGSRGRVDRVEVCWPGNRREVWRNVPVDGTCTLLEGTSSVADERQEHVP